MDRDRNVYLLKMGIIERNGWRDDTYGFSVATDMIRRPREVSMSHYVDWLYIARIGGWGSKDYWTSKGNAISPLEMMDVVNEGMDTWVYLDSTKFKEMYIRYMIWARRYSRPLYDTYLRHYRGLKKSEITRYERSLQESGVKQVVLWR